MIVLVAGVLLGLASAAATQGRARPVAGASPHRVGHVWGIVPAAGTEIAVGPREPLVFHGGVVMHGVTVHTVFWAPPGSAFGAAPSVGVPGYEPLLQRFLSDAAARPGGVFSILSQYGDGRGPGTDVLRYDSSVDSIDDPTPYPPLAHQCPSPGGVSTCVTDLQIERELDRVIAARHGTRGLHDVWVMLLPGNVDTCTGPGQCGSNTFAGYHSLFDLGHGPTVYAVIVDPVIEAPPTPGNDPQGNPDAERAADTIAHELVEAATDPQGTGWMDPDGGEAGDKCTTYYGTPLGYSANGSPYDQSLNGRAYLLQSMWSNTALGCVLSAAPAPAPRLPRVSLTQFSPVLSGQIARAGVGVSAVLVRGGMPVALARARTGSHGAWRATLHEPFGGPAIALGDDRDLLVISYGRGGPQREIIATDSGGNPFTQAGWTGWYDLDHGFAVTPRAVVVAPCAQTGVLRLRVGGRLAGSPVRLCQTETDAARVATTPIGAGTRVTLTSTDNRAAEPTDPSGALVSLSVALGEPGAVSAVSNPFVALDPRGFPSGLAACTADLRAQAVRCDGLVAGGEYRLNRLRARADLQGASVFAAASGRVWVRGGDTLTLRNRAGRAVTALHVAHLRVALRGLDAQVAGGSCEPGAYWGAQVSRFPLGPGIGAPSVGGSGTVCPLGGQAAGMAASSLQQSDPFSAGLTRTEVPVLAVTSPTPGETLYGRFIAFAQPALAGGGDVAARVTLAISRRGSHRVLRRVSGLQRLNGVSVTGLARGVYTAVWTVSDANGDTRITQSPFVEEG